MSLPSVSAVAPPLPHRARTWLVLALPGLVIAASLLAAAVAISRSGFWADDFQNLAHFDRSFGQLSNDHINTGKYVGNVFWGLGTEAFGTGSVIPFLVTNATVLFLGVFIWLRAGARPGLGTPWGTVEALWIAGLFVAAGAWWTEALWSSNIVHSTAMLGLGCGAVSLERAMAAGESRPTVWWMIAAGAAWTFTVISNLAYVGVLVLAVWGVIVTGRKLDSLRVPRAAIAAIGFWNLVVPLLYFFLVAYPATTSSSAYTHTGLSHIHANFEYYKHALAPHLGLQLIYVVIILIALAGGVVAARCGDWSVLVMLVTALAVTVPALVQSKQQELNYVAMALLLLFSAAVRGGRGLSEAAPGGYGRRGRAAGLVLGMIAIWLMFSNGADQRSYFVNTPYGRALATFRTEVGELIPGGADICVRMKLGVAGQSLLIAEMNGANGFTLPPINASGAQFVPAGLSCPVSASVRVNVTMTPNGDFVAARPRAAQSIGLPIVNPSSASPSARHGAGRACPRNRRHLRTALSAAVAAAAVAGCGSSSTTSHTRPATTPSAGSTGTPSTSTSGSATAPASNPQNGATISASPNPLTPGSGPAATTISWSVPHGQGAVIRVSLNGAPPKLFAEGGATGSAKAPFIVTSDRYVFTLSFSASPTKAQASVVVTRPAK